MSEAETYLNHKIPGNRLRKSTLELLRNNDLAASDVFAQVPDKFYDGKRGEYTINRLHSL